MNIQKITTFTALSVIIVLIAGLVACERVSQITQPTPTPPQVTEPSGEILIGVVLPLTGRQTASFGTPILQGLELALEEINNAQPEGPKLKFVIEDDQSTVDGAVAAFNTLIQAGDVPFILGPPTSSQTEQVFPIAQENQIVAISPTSSKRGLSALGDFLFRISLTTGALIPPGIEVTHAKLAYQSAATLYDAADAFSIDADEAVREVLTEKGIEVVAIETFQGGDTDFTEQLTRIKELNPDIVFLSSLPPEKPGVLIQARELGITAPFVLRTLTIDTVAAANGNAEGAMTFVGWNTTIDTPANQNFIQNYTAKYSSAPNNYAARAYATLYVLVEAITQAQSTDPTAVRDALANIKDLDTIFGTFSFDANGDAVYTPRVLIVKDGEIVPFE